MKEYRCCLKFKRGDNSTDETVLVSNNPTLLKTSEKHMKIQGKQLYVSMQCSCIDINMAELRESGESMQFLKVIEHANARLLVGTPRCMFFVSLFWRWNVVSLT
jgi:hypothetical protein